MKIGYHYTSENSWKLIQKEGMIPYLIQKPELAKFFDIPIKGIWCWTKELGGKSELGSVLFQVSTKQSTTIVKLKLLYTESQILKHENRDVRLYHDGHVGSWFYHKEEPAIILTESIPLERIKLVKEFDLIDMIKN